MITVPCQMSNHSYFGLSLFCFGEADFCVRDHIMTLMSELDLEIWCSKTCLGETSVWTLDSVLINKPVVKLAYILNSLFFILRNLLFVQTRFLASSQRTRCPWIWLVLCQETKSYWKHLLVVNTQLSTF